MSKKEFEEKGEPSTSVYLWATLGAAATILAGGLLVFYLYFITSKGPVMEDIVKQRKENLVEVRSKQAALINNYAWVNQKDGVVRIPINEAMALTVDELNKGVTKNR